MLWPLCNLVPSIYRAICFWCFFILYFLFVLLLLFCKDKNITHWQTLAWHTYSSWPAVAAPVLRPIDLGGTITIVPVPKALTILDLKHGAQAIWAGRMLQTLRVRGRYD